VAAAEVGGGHVVLQLPGERRQGVREVPQEREHLHGREKAFHHHEAHQVQAEITRDRGGLYRCAQPVQVRLLAGLRGLVDAAMPG